MARHHLDDHPGVTWNIEIYINSGICSVMEFFFWHFSPEPYVSHSRVKPAIIIYSSGAPLCER